MLADYNGSVIIDHPLIDFPCPLMWQMIFEKLKSGRYESIIVYNPKIFDIEALKYCYIALY